MLLDPGQLEIFNEGQVQFLLVENVDPSRKGSCRVSTSTERNYRLAPRELVRIGVHFQLAEIVNTGETMLDVGWESR